MQKAARSTGCRCPVSPRCSRPIWYRAKELRIVLHSSLRDDGRNASLLVVLFVVVNVHGVTRDTIAFTCPVTKVDQLASF